MRSFWSGLRSPRPFPASGAEADAALYETIRRTGTRLLDAARTTLGVLWPVLKWVGLALLLVASALLVYLAAVLLARLVVWASFP
jgi:hypothetical protein